MNFVTPQEAVHRRNMILQAQAQAQAQARRGPRPGQKGIAAMPKLGEGKQAVKFIVINKKK